jgi:hypothetical protein
MKWDLQEVHVGPPLTGPHFQSEMEASSSK